MSDAPRTYCFVVDALPPDRVPMARLAEYIADLVRLFGYKEHVHFRRVASSAADADVRAALSILNRWERQTPRPCDRTE